MKKIKIKNRIPFFSSASALLLMCACIKGENKNSNASTQDSLSYIHQEVPPDTYGGAWKRVWNLVGPYSVDAPVDVMLNRNGDNWKEVARTNREGVFIQTDTTREIKLRFDGHLETDWMSPLVDTMATQFTAGKEFNGRRCIVPEGTTLFIQNQKLILRCEEIIIEGKILAYPGNTYNGQGAGSVEVYGDIINIKGQVNLAGEQGSGGANGRNGGGGRENRYDCTNGGNGGLGGNGGSISIYAKKKLSLENEDEQLKVTGGAGGWGGRGGTGPFGANCRSGNAGPMGATGRIQVISPERPLP